MPSASHVSKMQVSRRQKDRKVKSSKTQRKKNGSYKHINAEGVQPQPRPPSTSTFLLSHVKKERQYLR